MALKIRLTRLGDKKSPFYRVVVADARNSRDGKVIENLGYYNPLKESELKIDKEKTLTWIKNGAQPTEMVGKIFKVAGIEK